MFAIAVGVLAATWLFAAIPDRVSGSERRLFETINGLPDWLRPTLFVVMQLGASWAIPCIGAIALLARRPVAALRIVAAGYAAWAGANVVKAIVERGRPAALFDEVTIRESGIDGFGFVSGHTAVACALATVAASVLGGRWRAVLFALAAIVGVARIYVGAHLPLDVIGGAALGLACGTLATLAPSAGRRRGQRMNRTRCIDADESGSPDRA